MLQANPSTAVTGYYGGLLNWAGEAQGFNVQRTTGTTTNFDLQDASGTLEARLQSEGAGNVSLRAELNNRGITLIGTDSVGADATLLTGSPDANVSLFYDNALAFFTGATGMFFRDTLSVNPKISFQSNVGALMTEIAHFGGSSLTIRSMENGIPVVIGGADLGGTQRNLFLGDPDGVASVYYAGDEALLTSTTGVIVQHPTSDDPIVTFRDNVSGTVAALGFTAANTSLVLDNNKTSGVVALTGTNSAVATASLATFNPDGSSDLYFAGTKTFGTISNGVDLWGSLNNAIGGTQDTITLLRNSGGTLLGSIGYPTSAHLVIRNNNHGGQVQLDAEDAGGFRQSMLIGDPDGSVDLYNAGTRVFITTANGADVLGTNFDVDNSLLTTEARITALNSVGGARLLVSGTTAGVTIAQTTAGGVWEKNVLSYVRDGAVSLWYNGAIKLNTTLNGIEVPGTQVDLNNSGLTTPTLIRARNSEGGFEWRADAGQAVLRQTNSGGTIEDVWIACNANSSVNLSHNGITKLSTTAEGVDVLHTAGALFDVVSSGVSTDAILGLRGATNGGARYYWDESTSTAFLRQTTPSGNVEDIWVEMVKNGEVSLHYNGVTKLSTLALGAQLLGVAGSVLIFDMDGSASSAAASLSARNIEGGYDLGANGGGFLLQQTASSGALEETWISGVEDGLVGLYHNGVEKFVTDAAGVIVTGHFEQTSMSVAPVGTTLRA